MTWKEKFKNGLERALNFGIIEPIFVVTIHDEQHIDVTRNGETVYRQEFLYSLESHWRESIREAAVKIILARVNLILTDL